MWSEDYYDRNSPQCPSTGALATSLVITGFLRVYGFTVYSSLASAQWILMFDASSLPADGAVPIIPFPVAASNQVSAYYGDSGRIFRRGLVLCCSTTDTTKTLGAANCFFDAQYDNI
jgi:hypothetical protein